MTARAAAARNGTAPLVLVDPPAGPFWPLAATRPVARVLAGTRTFLDRWAARSGPVAALWCDARVARAANGAPRVRTNRWPDPARGYRVALSTWVPPADFAWGDQPAELRLGGAPVGWQVPPAEARALRAASDGDQAMRFLRELGLRARKARGRRLDSLWAVMASNPALVADDAAEFASRDVLSGVDPFVLLGDAEDLRVGPDVAIGPFTVLDARVGPIVLDVGARIEAHALLRGPLYVGPGAVILGGPVTSSSIGPACRVRGEIEQSIFQGYANKAHEGFVGHSVIGEWVNLGAGTTTSDLKNTYGSVRLEDPSGAIDTGLQKVGAFLGDHVKTGIGTLLTTGTRVGAGSQVFGGGLAPAWLPDFSWHDGRARTAVRWEPFLRTAGIAMARRRRRMTAGEREILATLHADARRPRRRKP